MQNLHVVPYFYFGNLAYFSYLIKNPCVFETKEHFIKQTFRTRCTIATSQKSQDLFLPVIRERKTGNKTTIDQVKILNELYVKKQHWKSLVTAYQRSPFFEYYQADLEQLFLTEHIFLLNFHRASLIWIFKQLGVKFKVSETTTYQPAHFYHKDCRNFSFSSAVIYPQTFDATLPFLPNMSILDVLFNLSGKPTLTLMQTN